MTSKAATERNQRILLELARQPGNDKCADCRSPNPRWASWNLGIFLCVHCAGVHRKMGTHISKVRSITLDTWTREQVDAMKAGGNAKSNALYNPDEMRNRPPTNIEQSERGSELERYIRKKYEFKKFMDRGPPPVPQKDPPSMSRRPSPMASPRTPSGRSPNMTGASPSSSSVSYFPSTAGTTSSSNGRPAPSPATSQASSSARSLAVPPRSSSALSAATDRSSTSTSASAKPSNSSNLLIPDIDSIPTQPSPSPTIALYPPHIHTNGSVPGFAPQQTAYLSPAASTASFMDAFSVTAPATSQASAGSMGMGIVPSPSPSLSPFGVSPMQHPQQVQQAFGMGMGMLSPMATGSAYSPSPSPSIASYGASNNPFQQQQAQAQAHAQQAQANGSPFGMGVSGVSYAGYPAASASTNGLGMPFGSSATTASTSFAQAYPASMASGSPFGFAASSPMSPGAAGLNGAGMMMMSGQGSIQQQPQQQQQAGFFGGGNSGGAMPLQAQATGFNAFTNGMMPSHLRQSGQPPGGAGGAWA